MPAWSHQVPVPSAFIGSDSPGCSGSGTSGIMDPNLQQCHQCVRPHFGRLACTCCGCRSLDVHVLPGPILQVHLWLGCWLGCWCCLGGRSNRQASAGWIDKIGSKVGSTGRLLQAGLTEASASVVFTCLAAFRWHLCCLPDYPGRYVCMDSVPQVHGFSTSSAWIQYLNLCYIFGFSQ